MEKYGKLLQAAIIAFGLFLLGLCIKGGFDNFTNKDRRVTVKGLSEREVDANKVTWTIALSGSGDEMRPLISSVNAKVEGVKRFLKEKGLEGKSTITVESPSVTDNLSNYYGEHPPRYAYTVSRRINVSSNDTKLIDSVKSQEAELIDRDIILESSYTNYEYTKFQELKPEMMAEAIANAEKTASQFAENSHSKINKIVEAGQGEFSIDEGDVPYKKKIRVVSTITYSLKD
ncbi:MAG: SIMPL domain-containing protein [Prevotella sp.]|nr:SIMPL domain-containing protein [Prevotella sp.]